MLQQFKQIEDAVFIGPQPSLDDLLGLREQGVSTVVDLRHPAEIQSSNADLARMAGLDYVNIPIRKATISADDVARYADAMRTKSGKYLVHCGLGPRALLMVLLHQAIEQGWQPETLRARLHEGGLNLQANAEFVEFAENYLSGLNRQSSAKEKSA